MSGINQHRDAGQNYFIRPRIRAEKVMMSKRTILITS